MARPIYFRGGNSYLSNVYVCRIQVWNHVFNILEAAYMWKKCMHYGDVETAKINCSHTDWTTSEIPQQEHSREGTVTRKMEQTEILCNVCISCYSISRRNTTEAAVRHAAIAIEGMRKTQGGEYVHI